MTLSGQMWYFGGYPAQNYRQVSTRIIRDEFNLIIQFNYLILRKVKLLDAKWSDKMISRLNFDLDPVTPLQLRKKKLCCVSATIAEKNAICKCQNDD